MNAAAALLAASLGTYALRQVSVRALAHRELSAKIVLTLRHAALAVMAALVMSSAPSTGSFGLPSAAAIAGIAGAGVVARRTKSIPASIAISLVVYAAATAIHARL